MRPVRHCVRPLVNWALLLVTALSVASTNLLVQSLATSSSNLNARSQHRQIVVWATNGNGNAKVNKDSDSQSDSDSDSNSDSDPVRVTTNAPVFRWNSTVDPATCGGSQAVLSIRVNVSNKYDHDSFVWSSGDVRVNVLSTWLGLYVYEGPSLQAGATYDWTVEERVIVWGNGSAPASDANANGNFNSVVASGVFAADLSIPTARAEAAIEMSSQNMTTLWNTSWHSVLQRAATSGFLPTSVSGGYGGPLIEFPRDAMGQLIGLVEVGDVLNNQQQMQMQMQKQMQKQMQMQQATTANRPHADDYVGAKHSVGEFPNGTKFLTQAGRDMRFLLEQLQKSYEPGKSFMSYTPHVANANKVRKSCPLGAFGIWHLSIWHLSI